MAVKRRGGIDVPRMNDVQLLAHLLGMAGLETTPAREVSHALLDSYHDLRQVLTRPREDLLSYPGLGENAAAFLLLIPALVERYLSTAPAQPTPLKSQADVQAMLAPHFHGQDFERVCAFLLGDDLQPITSILVAQGGPAAVSCPTRRVIELALNHRAQGVILAHNHPDALPFFSQSDLNATSVLARELWLVGVPLLDHLLVAGSHIVSLRQFVRHLHEIGVSLPTILGWYPWEDEELP